MAEETAAQRDADALERQAEHDKNPATKGGKKVSAKLTKHKDMIVIALTIVSVMIAYLSFKGRGGKSDGASAQAVDNTGADDPFGGASYTSGFSTGVGTGTIAGGDSSAYGSSGAGATDGLAAYFDNLSDELAQLTSAVGANAGSNTTTPATPTPWKRPTTNTSTAWAREPASEPARFLFGAAARGLRYTRDRATGRIYQVNPNGRPYALTRYQYAALGMPKYSEYGTKPPARKK